MSPVRLSTTGETVGIFPPEQVQFSTIVVLAWQHGLLQFKVPTEPLCKGQEWAWCTVGVVKENCTLRTQTSLRNNDAREGGGGGDTRLLGGWGAVTCDRGCQ